MRFTPYYFFWTILLFFVELFIALFVRDAFVRPYLGDVLVVILIYALIRSLFKYSIRTVAVGVLLFAFLVEILQYFRIVEVLGLGDSTLARTIIGTTFVWEDFVAYTVGVLILIICERLWSPYSAEW